MLLLMRQITVTHGGHLNGPVILGWKKELFVTRIISSVFYEIRHFNQCI